MHVAHFLAELFGGGENIGGVRGGTITGW